MGGTNPSLLEALGSTKLNLLLDVGFNREVAENSALYWSKEPGSLDALLDTCDKLPEDRIAELGMHAKKRIQNHYTWQYIANQYESAFTNIVPDHAALSAF